jgi:hypothetical protein
LTRFTRPNPTDASRPAAPRSSTEAASFARAWAAVCAGLRPKTIAATPETCGVAIDVPDRVV